MSNPVTTPTHQVSGRAVAFSNAQADHTTYGVDAVR